MIKWLKNLFTSKQRKKVDTHFADIKHLIGLFSLEISRLNHKINTLTETVNYLIPDDKKEKPTGGKCIQVRKGSNSHVCMRGDVPMDARDYTGN